MAMITHLKALITMANSHRPCRERGKSVVGLERRKRAIGPMKNRCDEKQNKKQAQVNNSNG
jgi:hypothetical protein